MARWSSGVPARLALWMLAVASPSVPMLGCNALAGIDGLEFTGDKPGPGGAGGGLAGAGGEAGASGGGSGANGGNGGTGGTGGTPGCDANHLIAFVTATTVAPDVGRGTLDLQCVSDAFSHCGRKQFQAWLSADESPSFDARDALPSGEWYRADGLRIAPSTTALLAGSLENPIAIRADGQPAALTEVWTGTLVDGTKSASECMGWSDVSAGVHGTYGETSAKDGAWTDAGSSSAPTPRCSTASSTSNPTWPCCPAVR